MRFLLMVSVATIGCATAPARVADLAPSPPADAVVTLLHLNDVYEITPIEGGRAGGLARVATVRQRLLRERGQVLTTLGGDFMSPSALGTARVDGEALAGRQMVAVLNAMGLDWATLGNHEFDIAERLFQARVRESRFRYVISNVTDTAGVPLSGTVPRAIVRVATRGGRVITLGLVGTLLPATRAPWVRYQDQWAAVRREVQRLRDSVDAVIAITHQYYYEDDRLASEVDGIDVIVGGHEHDNFLLRRGARRTPIVKADGNARSAQVVTLHFGARGTRPVVTTELVPITDSIPEDPTVRAEVERWLDVAFAGYIRDGFAPRELVATIPEPLDARESVMRARPTNMTELMLAAMRREAPAAEIGIFNAGSIRIDDVVPAGPVTQYDVIRILPFGGPLATVRVTGRLIARTLLTGSRNVGIGGFLHTYGAVVQGDQVMVNGQPIDPDRVYTVVTTDFLLTGREANLPFFVFPAPEVTDRRNLRDVRVPLMEEMRARWGARGGPGGTAQAGGPKGRGSG
ncbi:MAG: bifunctional metallophosphatase/5'-nucleotidase [Gemmatimonadaceae bacterium]|nr:bifunctional metallophosphatase/5'-nucleotidase [Gemmatimonadaceae bacterium]